MTPAAGFDRGVSRSFRPASRPRVAIGVNGMSARKLPHAAPSAQEKMGPLAVRPSGVRVEGNLVQIQEKVLAEIGHELGNFFHKLYYWSDYLQEPARKTAESTAAQMLERTIRNLEQFLKVSFEYFHPIQLACTRMRADELVECLLVQVRAQANGTPITVDAAADWRDAMVMVDPGRFSHALEGIVRQLLGQAGPESSLAIEVARSNRRDGTGIEIAFRLQHANDASALFQTATAGLCWAVAEKVVALHGGELTEPETDEQGKHLLLFLPLYPP